MTRFASFRYSSTEHFNVEMSNTESFMFRIVCWTIIGQIM